MHLCSYKRQQKPVLLIVLALVFSVLSVLNTKAIAQSLGWTPYPDPNGYFDWTGSNITIQYVYAPGGSGYQPPVQNVRAYFSSMVSFGPPSILAATLQARGNPSTYKW